MVGVTLSLFPHRTSAGRLSEPCADLRHTLDKQHRHAVRVSRTSRGAEEAMASWSGQSQHAVALQHVMGGDRVGCEHDRAKKCEAREPSDGHRLRARAGLAGRREAQHVGKNDVLVEDEPDDALRAAVVRGHLVQQEAN